MKSSLRRSLLLFCVFTLITGLTAGNVAAAPEREGELIQEVVFEKTDLVFSEHEDYDVVTLARHGSTGEIGKPSLPQASFLVVIPPGARVKRVEIISFESEVISGTYKIMPAQPPKVISSEKSSVILNNIDYHAVTPFPGKLVQHAYTGSRGGYQVAGIFIYPLQYVPSEKSLRFYSSVKFKVIYQESTRPMTAKTPAQIEVFGDMVEEMVINPEDVSGWAPPVQSTSGNNHDYFIITSSEFVDEFQPLADWKNKKGVRTEIATIEDISLSYSGSNLQEKIKNFIIDMESTYGAIYFLLGGDTNVVPHKLLTTQYILGPLDGEPIPSDLYYSDLNGDLYSDVFVGRAPAENEDEVITFVSKVLNYEKNPPLVDYPLEALMMAFMLDSTSNAEDIKEECETHIPMPPFTVDEFYESQGEVGVSQATARINQGFGILNHADHTNYYAWGVGSGSMTRSDIDSLTNGNEQSVMYSIGCYSAAIEYDCCAERFLNNPSGGGVSYIGNSRYGWYIQGDATQLGGDLDEEFYISLFSRGLYNLGKAHADAKDQWVDDTGGLFYGPYYKYTILELNLLGDPEMPIWTDSISETNATHLSTIPLGASEFTVTVTENDGTPIEGALVCCMMDDFSVYEKGYTDTSGEVTLAVSPVHDGTMWVTASKHNYLPFEGVATVAGQDIYTLTVNTEGNGSVTLDPAGGSYFSGTVVNLTANADPGWTFDNWSGDLSGSTNPETITMDGNKNVTATFTQDIYTLTVNTVGSGSVEKDPDQATYVYNTSVQLTPNPDDGWSFSHWTGDLTGSTNPDSIIMTEDKTVTAHFTQDEYTLTVNTDGNGSVEKDPDQATYVYNTSVQLTANPDAGWSFSHWTGDLTGNTNPDSIIMTEDKTVTAQFTQNEYTLTVNTEGNGSVALSPAGGIYSSGTVVTLAANADSGWTFESWSGDLGGSANPETITMDGDKTVTANFTQDIYTLTVNTEGNGAVDLDPAGGIYSYGTVVNLTANADSGWTFSGWSGDLGGSTNPETITMDDNKNVTATFTQDIYTLTVNTEGNGSVDLSPTGGSYSYGTVVTLTANADSGWTFDGWSGHLGGSTNPETITMDGNKIVTATFTQDMYTLAVNTVGNGSVAVDPAGGSYSSGTVVNLTANADPGWTFTGWSGDLGGSTNPETVIMDGDKTVTATFTQDTYTLTVNTEGNGSVDLDPAGGSYPSGTVVTLTANADPGWTFDSWSGDLGGSANPETITMDGDKTVTATFTQDMYTLAVNTIGNGSVAVDPAGGSYLSGTIVTLTANADPGWTFDGWSGDLGGSANPETITMDDNKNVTATFNQDTYTLTVNTVGNGSVELSPAGGSYPSGTVVTLTANADPGWTFDGWSGDLDGADNPKTITMDSNKIVTATFTQDTYTLTVNTEGNGSVDLDPAGGSYPSGTVVTLTANAASGWTFDSWSGDLGGSANPETITMDGDKTVTATFTQDMYTLTVNTEGNGSVSLDPAGGSYPSGTAVTLTANAASGWTFSGWSGDLGGSANPETITMDGDKTVTATFTQDIYTLTVNTEGNGSVDLSPAGGSYSSGTVVNLTANADPGWTFTGWSGDLGGSTNPETVIMDGNKTVTATFTQDMYTLDFANQDMQVSGTVSGSYIDTQSRNGDYESITEILSPGRSGKSYLEHKWTIDVTGGATVTFYVEAYHSSNSEGDDFEFSYSTDDSTYNYMLTVVKTENNSGYQAFSLPGSLSGTVYIRVTDTDQTRGNKSLDTIYIDNMYIESSPSTDTIPPSQVTDLSTSIGDYGQVILTWTAPGDDGTTGIASEYDIRYVPQANGPIETEGEWLGATLVTGEPAPSVAGTLESMTVGGLEPGASYCFAIKTADEVPSWSALSNSPPGTAGSDGTVKDFANQDIPISGVVSGDYIYTHSSDDSYQSITEVKSRGKSKENYLQHKWTINVTGGTTVTFYVEAYHSPNSEGDDFEFSYSTDDDTYIHMLTVEKTADTSTYETFTLPSNLSGTVYILVTDKDRTIGNRSLDTIYIDYMYIESEL